MCIYCTAGKLGAITVDDPKACTKPWTVTLNQRIAVDTELIAEIYLEGEQSFKHIK